MVWLPVCLCLSWMTVASVSPGAAAADILFVLFGVFWLLFLSPPSFPAVIPASAELMLNQQPVRICAQASHLCQWICLWVQECLQNPSDFKPIPTWRSTELSQVFSGLECWGDGMVEKSHCVFSVSLWLISS